MTNSKLRKKQNLSKSGGNKSKNIEMLTKEEKENLEQVQYTFNNILKVKNQDLLNALNNSVKLLSTFLEDKK